MTAADSDRFVSHLELKQICGLGVGADLLWVFAPGYYCRNNRVFEAPCQGPLSHRHAGGHFLVLNPFNFNQVSLESLGLKRATHLV